MAERRRTSTRGAFNINSGKRILGNQSAICLIEENILSSRENRFAAIFTGQWANASSHGVLSRYF
jgi:hypothetical protein